MSTVFAQCSRGQCGNRGVAVGDFFPRIGLMAFYGGASSELNDLLSSSANTSSLAASTAGPLFTGGRLTGRCRQAKPACEEAKLHYQQTALSAFREVSDGLVSHRRFDEKQVEQARAVEANREAVELAAARRLAVIQLYKALGGGSSLKNSEWSGMK